MFLRESRIVRERQKKVVLCFAFILCLQTLSAICVAQVKLGELSFNNLEGENLAESMTLDKGRSSHHFLSKVGGVAFGGIAVPVGSLRIVDMDYDTSAPDGSRVKITVDDGKNKKVVVAPVYDWQIVPITMYAAGDFHAAFTLFGSLVNNDEEKARRDKGQRILNYHSAFADTLLGLRLFQGDILILNPDASQLPSVDGKVLLGAGEQAPDVKANLERLNQLRSFLRELGDEKFQSYVVSDINQTVTFSISQEGQLKLTGFPYWHCWKRVTNEQQKIKKTQKKALKISLTILGKQFEDDKKSLTVDQHNAKYTKENQRKLFEELFDAEFSKRLIRQMPKYSRKLSKKIRQLGGINPAVYQALTTTMRYAAFLRHVRLSFPDVFNRFREKLAAVPVFPVTQTPTVMIP